MQSRTSSVEDLELALARLKDALVKKLELAGLHSRNPTAHKWKAPYRSLHLREAAYWRILDLLDQSFILHGMGHALGARILLRSALETIAMLIYLNRQTEKLLTGAIEFKAFSEKTEKLLLGSRNGGTKFNAVHINDILKECDKRHPGIQRIYDDLSESAHPNYEGISRGYAVIDRKEDTITFSNRWMSLYGETHPDDMMLCLRIFMQEYDAVWTELFERLENWIEKNDTRQET